MTQFRQVKAVVMETTGDISVLQHSDENHTVDEELLENLRGADMFKGNNSDTAGI